jgi:uncharacterized repeat protein (TIGR01451 family)
MCSSFINVRIPFGLRLFTLLVLGLMLAVERIEAQADLAVTVTGPASVVYTNDLIFYSVSVVNQGPSSASNVFLINTLPPGMGFINYSPSNQIPTIQGSSVSLNLGKLTNGAVRNFQLAVQPANAGFLTFVSFVTNTSPLDPNLEDNLASNSITVGTFVYGQLIATNASAMNYNPQTGLMTNTIRLTNIGTNLISSARVIVSGLTNWLYNAVGTNSGNPYVVSGQLAPNESTNLVLKIFVPTRTPITVTNYIAVALSLDNLPPVLPAIPAQFVNERTLLTVANTATEPNSRATTIGYGLIDPPAGVNIDSNGVITWTPAWNQSPSVNTITTVVTNSDPFDLVNPNLTATNSFTVVVLEVNIAPILPGISDQTAHEMALLTVTNAATETDTRATILGYGLIDPPAGMNISSNGIITWIPTRSSPDVNLITTVVTNNDPYDLVTPYLTATNSFTVAVLRLALGGPTLMTNGNFQFVFDTGAGANYTVQYTTNLMDWISLSSFIGPGGLITVQDPNATNSSWRFYRVLVGQ